MTHKLRLAVVVVSLLVVHAVGFCQNTAELRGKVVDKSGRPVVSAFVIVATEETSSMRAATTDEAGEFKFTSLPVDSYKLTIKAEGFAPYESSGIRVSIGQVVTVNAVLGATASSELPKIAGASMLDLTSTQLGVVMTDTQVVNLPLKARDTFELLQLQPGVQSTLGSDLFFGSNRPGVVSVNGARARSNNYNVNGGHSGDQFVNFPSMQPSPESVREFRVISHNYDAELGRNSGSVLNVVTMPGTHSFHGTVYEFLRNRALNAKGFFDLEKPDFKQNDFGADIGGRLDRDKTFFFLSYSGRRLQRGITSDPVMVPSTLERAGDFSAGAPFAGILTDDTVASVLQARAGCAAAVAAQGGAPIAAGTAYADIFPGNVIPTECFDSTAADLWRRYVPDANVGADVFQATPLAVVRQDQAALRLDRNISHRQQLSAYYYFGGDKDQQPFARLQGSGANVPGFGTRTRERFQQFNLSHNWQLDAKTNNQFRVVYYRDAQGQFLSPESTKLVQNSCADVPADSCFSDPLQPQLGITPGLGATREGVPFINVAGGFAIGNNPNGTFAQTGNVYQFVDTFSRIAGRHTIKTGVDVRNQRFKQIFFYDVNGDLELTGGGPNDVGYDNLFPNYLLGLTDTYSQGSANAEDVRTTQFHPFIQDSWKLKSNLTMNYGLRWELNTPQADAGRRIQAFRPGTVTAAFNCALDSTDPLLGEVADADCSPTGAARSVFPLGLVFPGDKGVPAGLTNTYFRAFAPRLGLAWSPAWDSGPLAKLTGGPGRTSVRAGWGLFYDANEQLILESFSAQPPFGGSNFLTNVFLNTPFLSQDGTVNPNPFRGISTPARGSDVDFALFRPIQLYGNFPATLRNQYAVHYNVTLQRELSFNTLLQVGYVGSQGHRLLATIDQNYGNPQACLDLNLIPGMSCGPFGADDTYLVPANAIPAGVTLHLPYGTVPSITGPNPNPITLVGLRKYSSPLCEPTTGEGCPEDGIPVFGSIFGIDPLANSSYHSLQVLANHRIAHGLQFLASYTWSKSIDNASSFENTVNPIDPRRSRSPSLFDSRHRLVFSYYWRLPDLASGWTGHLANGWAIAGITTLQTGFPIRITSFSDTELMSSVNYETPGEPDQVGEFRVLDPRKSGGYYFDPSAFADSALGQIGNAPRTICCGPGIANFDVAVHKSFSLGEGRSFQFRTEVFNLFNRTQFMNPDGNITSGSGFGMVRRSRDPRLLQFAARVTF